MSQNQTKITFTGSTKFAIIIIALAAGTWLLEKMSTALIPFIFAIFLYYNILPVMQYCQRRFKVGHGLSVLLALLFYAIVYLFLGLFIASSLKSAIKSVSSYREQVKVFNEQILIKIRDFGFEIKPEQINSSLQKIEVFDWLGGISGGVAEFLGTAGLITIFTLFLLSGRAYHGNPLLHTIQNKLIRYVIAKTIVSFATGILVGGSLAILGVDMAALFGLLSFLLNFIPNIGSLIAIFLPLPVVLLQHGFGAITILSLAIPGGIQFLLGNFLEPKMLGETLDLHPITVLLALIYWGIVWGITGMFLAVPITAVMKIVFERIPSTYVLSKWMSGKFS